MRAVTLVFFPDNKGDNYFITSFIHCGSHCCHGNFIIKLNTSLRKKDLNILSMNEMYM